MSMSPKTGHFRITGFLDFVHRPVFKNKRTQRFGNWICFRPKVGKKIATLLRPLERSNLNQPHLRKEIDPVSETLCYLVS
jgi:hypothetical protein